MRAEQAQTQRQTSAYADEAQAIIRRFVNEEDEKGTVRERQLLEKIRRELDNARRKVDEAALTLKDEKNAFEVHQSSCAVSSLINQTSSRRRNKHFIENNVFGAPKCPFLMMTGPRNRSLVSVRTSMHRRSHSKFLFHRRDQCKRTRKSSLRRSGQPHLADQLRPHPALLRERRSPLEKLPRNREMAPRQESRLVRCPVLLLCGQKLFLRWKPK